MERKWTINLDREQATNLLTGSAAGVEARVVSLGISSEDAKEHLSEILAEARWLMDSAEPWNDMDTELNEKWPDHLKERANIAALSEENLRMLLEQKGFSKGWIARYVRPFWNDARGLAEYKRLHEQFPLGLDEPDRHALTVQQKYR